MLKKFIAIALMATAFSVGAQELTASVSAVSNYSLRGISQTHGGPAVQAGVDYSSVAGPYIGVFASNVTWVKDATGAGTVEADAYAGYRSTLADVGYDVGIVRYTYPGHGTDYTWVANPDTTEVYAQLSYGIASVKYSEATSKNFVGWYTSAANSSTGAEENSKGSNYLEVNANYDLGNAWTLSGHIGRQVVKGYAGASYVDQKVAVTKAMDIGTVGLAVSGTNYNHYSGGAYDWGTNGWTGNFKNVAGTQVILSFLKGF